MLALLTVGLLTAAPSTSSATTSVTLEMSWPESTPRFTWPEYGATGALVVLNTFNDYIFIGSETSGWDGGILFDDAVIRATDGFDRETVRTLSDIGDVTLFTLTFWPFVVDSLLTATVFRRSLDTGWQTAMISLQSTLLSSLVNLIAKRFIPRSRPGEPICTDALSVSPSGCPSGGAIHSFYSGHATQNFVSASLICVNHEFLDLWGGGWADHAVCATALAAATFSSTMRVINRAHYLSDVLIGVGTGVLIGAALPYLLHYGRDTVTENSAMVVPFIQGDAAGLSLSWRY